MRAAIAYATGGSHLSSHHDIAALAAAFARDGHCHIARLFDDAFAWRLHRALSQDLPWQLTVLHGGPQQMPLSRWQALPKEQRRALEAQIGAAARRHFQGRYLGLHLSDKGEPFTGPFAELVTLTRMLNSEPFLAFVRAVTGDDSIAFADAQATCYRAGDFLTSHSDERAGENRIAAYVLNLNPEWRPEWGGLLNFTDGGGHVIRAYSPAFNALNLLKVPQPHFVSSVADYVDRPRLSVTGWLRRR